MKKIKIETHDGEIELVDVEEYNALETVESINNSQDEHVIAFGDYIFSKINIKSIKPVTEEVNGHDE